MPTTAEVAAKLLAVFEGPVKLKSYRDSGGVWTIGRGHTEGVGPGMTISREQSDALFAKDQAPLLTMVEGLPPVRAAAYVSFGFNCGAGALHAVLNGLDTMSNPKHTTDRRGVVLEDLVSRRALEIALVESA